MPGVYSSGKNSFYASFRDSPQVADYADIESVAPKPNTSRPRKEHKVYPYLLKKLSITKPDHVWCSDITYIRMAHGFVYLTAVMDWASRYVLSWEVSVTMDDDFCVNALKSEVDPKSRTIFS